MRKKKIIFVVEDTKAAQFRYRVKNILDILKESSEWEGEWVATKNISAEIIVDVNLVVILRQTAKDRKFLDFIRMAHERKVKVLFDLDDLIFDYRDLFVLMRGTNSKNIFYWMGYFLGIRKIAKMVDGFTTTNDYLARKLKRSFRKPTRVISNSLNIEQLEVANEVLNEKKHDGFIIGYFSGSPTHVKDLRMVESDIFRLLDSCSDARLMIVGYIEPSSEMKKRINNKQIKIMRFVDYLEQLKIMSKVDVNIAPLVISEFSNCKSELKFFEAAVVETVTIASPTYSFRKAISNGKDGFLAQPDEWYGKLKYLYDNPKERQKIARSARKYVLERYYGKNFLRQVESAYEYFD